MTMTPERLAELDAAYEKQAGTPFGEKPVRVEIVLALCRWMHADPFWYFQGAIK